MAKDITGVRSLQKVAPAETDNLEESKNIQVKHPNRNTQKKKQHQFTRQQERQQATPVDISDSAATTQSYDAIELPYRLDKKMLTDLAQHQSSRCISIYLPVHSGGVEVNDLSDALMFKNMIQEATLSLLQDGMSKSKIEKWLAPAYALSQDPDFWRNQRLGLAFFAGDDYCRYIRLPNYVQAEVMVNDHFLLTPLIPSIGSMQNFWLLLLSRSKATLFHGDQYGMEHIDVPGLPQGIDDVVHFEERDETGVVRAGGGGKGTVNYHGIGGGRPDDNKDLAQYFMEVSKTLEKEVLANEHAPLIIAGVEYLHPIYMGVSKYKHIIQSGLKGNYERTTTPELLRLAMEKIQPLLDQEVQQWIDHYNDRSASQLTSANPSHIIPAAHFGQVGRLFIREGAHLWGHFDEKEMRLDMRDEKRLGDDCLINEAAMHTLLHGGYVHALPADKMPGGPSTVMAALMRYPA